MRLTASQVPPNHCMQLTWMTSPGVVYEDS
jgi:hypothetical protein